MPLTDAKDLKETLERLLADVADLQIEMSFALVDNADFTAGGMATIYTIKNPKAGYSVDMSILDDGPTS